MAIGRIIKRVSHPFWNVSKLNQYSITKNIGGKSMFNLRPNRAFLCGFMPVFNTQVKYLLNKNKNALTLQVLDQSPDITAFLSQGDFHTSTGFIIGLSEYPEFKISKNYIFLRGTDKSNDFKPDVTRFVGRMQRDNAYDLFVKSVQELVNAVKQATVARPVNVLNAGTPYGGQCFQAPKIVRVRAHNRSYPGYGTPNWFCG
jgi:hypothetical protein